MKTTALLNTQICTCPNQFLLASGEVCELCMGIVSAVSDHHGLPTHSHVDIFDEFYFEELETFYEDIEYAA